MEIADTDLEDIIWKDIKSNIKTMNNYDIYKMLSDMITTLYKLKLK